MAAGGALDVAVRSNGVAEGVVIGASSGDSGGAVRNTMGVSGVAVRVEGISGVAGVGIRSPVFEDGGPVSPAR
jgi:hypothetical protein